ncbi:hypothetical protein SAMN02799631_04323 [Methylobacterium sp. 174MFSha1.1]|uniref:hypothetical protein n=1 Tax=Methylobacterium sp. 174MFSha1.1 TaxID=1502749 RepID=UPI0008F36C66|nr:hypothetical protein [Methylobacterium sp. 174MFSha1.1]SFV05936.1 hypothetical protein SAMN02799631_04323 [Methylobacterium sp. 174MFSha1.1]
MQALADIDAPLIETSVASAGTCDIGATSTRGVLITGTTTVTSFGSRRFRQRFVRFGSALILTHNATSLILPGAANITTAAGDTAVATSDGSGNWTVRDYARATGKALAGPAAADITDASTSGRAVLTGTAASGATALGLGTGNTPTFAGLATTGSIVRDGPAGTSRNILFTTNGVARWEINADNGAESGGNVGTNLTFSRFDDAGNFLGTIFYCLRSDARMVFPNGMETQGVFRHASYTVGTLPAGTAGGTAFVSNGRKPAEAAGAGTGVLACYSNGAWRRLSDETAVVA